MLGANRVVRQLGERVRGAEARGEKTNTNLLTSRRLRRKLLLRQLGGSFSRRENFYRTLLRSSRYEVLEEKEKISMKYGRRLKSGVLKNVRGDGENFYEIRTKEKEEKGKHSFRLPSRRMGISALNLFHFQ